MQLAEPSGGKKVGVSGEDAGEEDEGWPCGPWQSPSGTLFSIMQAMERLQEFKRGSDMRVFIFEDHFSGGSVKKMDRRKTRIKEGKRRSLGIVSVAGENENLGSITICWEAEEKHLIKRPNY